MRKKINIITPVYNEEEGITHFDTVLRTCLLPLTHKYWFEIIYVLDKSRDNTAKKIKSICENNAHTKLLTLSRRFGHQLSLMAGIDLCDGEALIMLDCDLEHPPQVIPLLLEKFEEGYEIVNTKREYAQKAGFFKKLSSQLFYKFINSLSSVPIEESSADFRLLSRKAYKVFQEDLREKSPFVRGLVSWVGFKNTAVPFVSATRQQGVSKYNLRRLVSFAIAGIIAFSKVPLRWSIFLGFCLSVFSVAYAIFSIFLHFFVTVNQKAPGFPTLIIFISLIGGMQLIVLGIIGEYIGNIFEEVKNRPLYIVEEIFEQKDFGKEIFEKSIFEKKTLENPEN